MHLSTYPFDTTQHHPPPSPGPQVLTWLLLPFFQVYADAGDFTVGARCMTSLKENGLLYGLAGGAGAVGLCVIVFVQKSFQVGGVRGGEGSRGRGGAAGWLGCNRSC